MLSKQAYKASAGKELRKGLLASFTLVSYPNKILT